MIADVVVGMLGGAPSPMFVTGSLFVLSAGLTQFMSNTASTALLAPIGISIAKGIGASPHAVMMAIAVAASCAFATPVGTPPNTLVLGPKVVINLWIMSKLVLVWLYFVLSFPLLLSLWYGHFTLNKLKRLVIHFRGKMVLPSKVYRIDA